MGDTVRLSERSSPPPTSFQQKENGNAGAAYTITVQWRSNDMKNPDSTWQQLSTILAGLSHNHCGVWSLDRFWGWLETKKLKSSPAVQQETPCWKCHNPSCPQPHFSQIAQEFTFHRSSPENSTFPKTLNNSHFSLTVTFRKDANQRASRQSPFSGSSLVL